jgi:hypothetical protein
LSKIREQRNISVAFPLVLDGDRNDSGDRKASLILAVCSKLFSSSRSCLVIGNNEIIVRDKKGSSSRIMKVEPSESCFMELEGDEILPFIFWIRLRRKVPFPRLKAVTPRY